MRIACEFFGTDLIRSGNGGDLILEFLRPDADTLLSCMSRKYETLDDIDVRVNEAKKMNVPDLSTMSDTCYQLFKTAYNRLGLGTYETEIIFNVSQTIACMAGSSKICPEHIAEAIQYRSVRTGDNWMAYTF